MKKWIVLWSLLFVSLSGWAQTERGDSSVGLNLGYGFDSENVNLGIDYRYNITDAIRINPGFTYFIKNNGLSACAIDLNAHYVIKLSDVFGFYPLAGLDLSFWKSSVSGDLPGLGGVSISKNYTRFGANVGLGAEVYATDELSVGLEVKYNIIKDIDQVLLGLRVGYNF